MKKFTVFFVLVIVMSSFGLAILPGMPAYAWIAQEQDYRGAQEAFIRYYNYQVGGSLAKAGDLVDEAYRKSKYKYLLTNDDKSEVKAYKQPGDSKIIIKSKKYLLEILGFGKALDALKTDYASYLNSLEIYIRLIPAGDEPEQLFQVFMVKKTEGSWQVGGVNLISPETGFPNLLPPLEYDALSQRESDKNFLLWVAPAAVLAVLLLAALVFVRFGGSNKKAREIRKKLSGQN